MANHKAAKPVEPESCLRPCSNLGRRGSSADPEHNLNNGLPSALTALIEALELKNGHTVRHAGTGNGYYAALIAHCVGETGRVVGLEIDSQLATRARENLKQPPQVEVLCAMRRPTMPARSTRSR